MTLSRSVSGILNLLGFIGVIVVNTLANALPINGITTGQLSDLYPNLFVPAGLTFAIWGLIYLLLAVFSVYQLVCAFGSNSSQGDFIDKIGIWFFVSCLANMAWIFVWHYQWVFLSLVIMLTILGSLIAIYQNLGIGNSSASNREKYLVHLPFSIYLGWISIATIANVTTVLVDTGWNGFGISEAIWAVVMIVIGTALTFRMLLSRNDIFYSLVVVWAFLGIWLKRSSAGVDPVQIVIWTSLIGLILILVGIILQVARRRVY